MSQSKTLKDGISIYYILKYSFTLCIFVGFGMLKKKENKDRANVSSRIPLSYLGTLRINLVGESSDDSGDNDDEIEFKWSTMFRNITIIFQEYQPILFDL
jgi:hypothetical protein